MSKVFIECGWDDVPHLTEQAKQELMSSIPLHQRDARTKGIPEIGAGAIWPISPSMFTYQPFALPPHYARAYALDVGWNNTATLHGAHDRDTDTIYIYDEYKKGELQPVMHAANIKAKGAWIKGCIDPAARGRSQGDGKQLYKQYKDAGLKLVWADNSREAGILEVYDRLSQGRLKIAAHLSMFFEEFRIYRRDKHGKVVKNNDHLMDCLRYLVMTLRKIARTRPSPQKRLHSIQNVIADPGIGY